jgi:hypothetical protein
LYWNGCSYVPTRECDISETDIPSIAKALSQMNSEILDASLILPRMQEASLSNFVEADDRREANALVESSFNLKVVTSGIQDRMPSLEVSLRKNALVPATLSNAALVPAITL